MAVVESFIPVPTTSLKLDGVAVTTSEGLAVRALVRWEFIFIALLRLIEQDEDDIEAILLAIA